MSRLQRETASILVLCFAHFGCSSPAVDVTQPQSSAASTNSWIAEAEADSRLNLEDRCGEHAPMSLVWTKHPDYLACAERAERAVRDEWEALTRSAVERCAASSGTTGCCFARRTGDAQFEPHLAACNRECASRVRGPVASAPMCRSVVVEPATMERFHTPAVEATIARCENGIVDAFADCSSMPSLVERLTCVTGCRRLVVRARFVEAAKVCARNAASGGPVKCALRDEDLRPGFTKEECENLCRSFRLAPPP